MMKVSKKSWHYRFLNAWVEDWNIPRNRCGYWASIFWYGLVTKIAMSLIAFGLAVLAMPAIGLFVEFTEGSFLFRMHSASIGLWLMGAFCLLLTAVIYGFILLVNWLTDLYVDYLFRKRMKKPGKLQLTWRKFKSKMCPPIEFTEGDD